MISCFIELTASYKTLLIIEWNQQFGPQLKQL